MGFFDWIFGREASQKRKPAPEPVQVRRSYATQERVYYQVDAPQVRPQPTDTGRRNWDSPGDSSLNNIGTNNWTPAPSPAHHHHHTGAGHASHDSCPSYGGGGHSSSHDSSSSCSSDSGSSGGCDGGGGCD